MPTRAQTAQRLVDPGIIAVVRVPNYAQVLPLSRALVEGGVRAVEITLTTPRALEAIRLLRRELDPSILVGAGTVVSARDALAVLEAGAEFLISPITRPEIVPVAHDAGCPVLLGAYTPTEAQTAHEAGADFIKLFPATTLGPDYIKNLLAPLPHLKIVPTGGVDLQTAAAFLQAGCAALGVGSSLLTKDILRNENWPELTRLAQAYVQIAQAHASHLQPRLERDGGRNAGS